MGNCACFEGKDANTSGSKPKKNLESGRKFGSDNEIWIKEFTKKLVAQMVEDGLNKKYGVVQTTFETITNNSNIDLYAKKLERTPSPGRENFKYITKR